MKYATFIGVTKYLGGQEFTRLDGCVNDAKLWYQKLTNQFGFQSLGVRENYLCYEIIAEYENLIDKLKAGDIGVFFFSGHGIRNESKDGRYYVEGIMDHLYRTVFDDEIHEKLEKLNKDALLILIFDTCFSGGIQQAVMDAEMITKSSRRKYTAKGSSITVEFSDDLKKNGIKHKPGEGYPNVIFLSASADDKRAYERSFTGGKVYGLFSYYAYNIIQEDMTYGTLVDKVNQQILFNEDKEVSKEQKVNISAEYKNQLVFSNLNL